MTQALIKEIKIGSRNTLLKKRIITHYIHNYYCPIKVNK